MLQTIEVDRDVKGVATLTLNRPNLHNAFNDRMISEIKEQMKVLASDDSVRLVFIQGKGKSFCAGADLNWMKDMKDYTEEENFKDSQRLAEMFKVCNQFPKPLIALVQGAALGGGSGLVASCDYCVCTRDSVFGFTEVRLGLVPAVISPFVVSKIGESQARAYFLSGARFKGEMALNMGLVHQVVETEKSLLKAKELLTSEFLQAAPHAQIEAKRLIFGLKGEKPDKSVERTCKVIARLRVGEEGQEGMQSLLEKRTPAWNRPQHGISHD